MFKNAAKRIREHMLGIRLLAEADIIETVEKVEDGEVLITLDSEDLKGYETMMHLSDELKEIYARLREIQCSLSSKHFVLEARRSLWWGTLNRKYPDLAILTLRNGVHVDIANKVLRKGILKGGAKVEVKQS